MEEDQELTVLLTHANNHTSTPAPIIKQDNSDALLKAVLDNNEEELTAALSVSTEKTFRRKYEKYEFKNIVTIACERPEVSDTVFEGILKHVLKKLRNVDLIEESWYYWEPLHFAAYYIDVGKLKIITKYIDKARINALTVFSENALHVLLEYGKRIESFNVQLSNGWESRICHVIAQERRELVDSAKELIDAGIDVNHVNMWNETPLIIAIRYRLIEIIELLLKRRDIDLDSSTDPYTCKSARDLLRESEICVHLLNPTTSLVQSPSKILFAYLKSGYEELFLRYNNENIRQYSNDLDGDSELNTSGTMLHLCLIKGFIEYVKDEDKLPENDKYIMNTSMLKVFCKKGFVRSIEHLLDNNADVFKRTRLFGNRNVFQIAVKFSYYPFLVILLQHKKKQIGQYDVLEALKNTCQKCMRSNNFYLTHVLHLLLTKLEIFYDTVKLELIDYDSRRVLNDILDLYLRYNDNREYDENICQVLRLGASLLCRQDDFSRLKRISYETLCSHLDDCIDSTNNVCYNSVIFDEFNNYSEIKVLHYLSHDSKKTDLLNHPALVYLIHVKWLHVNKFFYWNILFYSMFLISLYVYMVSLEIGDNSTIHPAVWYSFVILLAVHTLKELLQLLLYQIRYFFDFTNYIEVLIIGSCYLNIYTKNEVCMILAILLSTLIFLMMLGQLPRFTKYMIIFSSTKYFFEYAMFYFLQFFSFALCFFILLPPEDDEKKARPINEILVKLFDSLIFFIGQYDGPISSPEKFPIFGRIIVAVFIFCMTIILNNLLVGLIVTDMDVIQKTSKLLRQVKMVKYIVRIETFLRRMDGLYCCRPITHLLGITNVFEARRQKFSNLTSSENIFDDEDKAWLKEIHEGRKPRDHILKKLYEHIVSEVYSDHKNMKENKDILSKLARLEEHLAKLKH